MLLLSALPGSVLGHACLCAADKLCDRVQVILICSATLLEEAGEGAATVCAVLFS